MSYPSKFGPDYRASVTKLADAVKEVIGLATQAQLQQWDESTFEQIFADPADLTASQFWDAVTTGAGLQTAFATQMAVFVKLRP